MCAAMLLGFTGTFLATERRAVAAETASLPAAADTAGEFLPEPLSAADARRYTRIFDVQENGDWRTADGLVAKLDDRMLLGHVLAQRYLHPTRYRTSYRELYDWLGSYADHPDAARLHALALKRKPAGARSPSPPVKHAYPSYESFTIIEHSGYRPADRAGREIISRVHRMVRLRRLTAAEEYVAGAAVRKVLGTQGTDLAHTLIASGWFFHGDSARALALADASARQSGKRLPYAHWIGGLSAYRLSRHEEAADHFEAVARAGEVRGWDLAAAAFWAARANMIARRPDRVNRWLTIAAEQPHTFYGIIARRWLGDDSPFNWEIPALTKERLELVTGHPAGRRALALLQVGIDDRAGRELRLLPNAGDPEAVATLVAIADRKSLPTVSLRTGAALPAPAQLRLAGALYPVPAWKPREGFRIDRALIFAFMRQESAFNIHARSSAGARGLMQLMPATAGYIAQQRFTGNKRNRLYDPELNLSL
ncbi:MAG: transglycosylase SLT domain-containing protein, partial [Rhodospirillaceae bacterium]